MTDIELAEKYFDEECPHSYADNREQLEEDVVQGFLAGLKAGRPQWHKVPNDLPKENKVYFVAIKDNGLAIAYFNGLNWETKYNLGDFGHCVETVIAWCEIPQFKESE